jgi:hypothetical protein
MKIQEMANDEKGKNCTTVMVVASVVGAISRWIFHL